MKSASRLEVALIAVVMGTIALWVLRALGGR